MGVGLRSGERDGEEPLSAITALHRGPAAFSTAIAAFTALLWLNALANSWLTFVSSEIHKTYRYLGSLVADSSLSVPQRSHLSPSKLIHRSH